MNISVFLGAPGSGKGTQAKKLAESHGYRHFSTGDMLRAAMAAGSEMGKKVKAIVDKGDLVPDAVMIDIIRGALAELKSDAKVILDGFPRTEAQADALDRDKSTSVNNAIYFTMPQSELVERLTGRRTCGKCGEPFHVKFLPPKKEGFCNKCGSALTQRADDTEEVVKHRLDVYNKQTAPLLDYYRKRSKLKDLQANVPVDQVQQNLLKLLQ